MNWPMGDRDTTEFPEVSVNFDINLREHLEDILSIPDGVDANDYSEIRKTSFEGKANQRVRTYRKLYERLGVVYRRDGKIYRSKLGMRLSSLEKELNKAAKNEIKEISDIIVKVLKKYQYVNPLDAATGSYSALPKVHPYFLLWKVMQGLDGKIHHQEINRVLLKLTINGEANAAIKKIKNAREVLSENFSDSDLLTQLLGEPVITNQPSARIAPLFSLAGWGGLLINRDADQKGFRHFNPDSEHIIFRALQTEPSFFETHKKEEWIEYYFSNISVDNEKMDINELSLDPSDVTLSEIQKRINRLGGHYEATIIEQLHLGLTFHPDKHFVIIKGQSGTGKTLLVRTYSRALFDIASLDIPLPNLFISPVRPNWTDPSQVLGYFDVLSNHYVVPVVLEAILTAKRRPNVPVFLCFDEMNLSRVEYYFSDVLSAMESREEFELHSHGENVTCNQGRSIPEKLLMPSNLYIIGTINVDESTSSISDKVLDRAVIVNLEAGQISNFLSFLKLKRPAIGSVVDDAAIFLTKLGDILSEGGQDLNMRSVEEIILYLKSIRDNPSLDYSEHLDRLIDSKVVSKLKGDENSRNLIEKLKAVFKEGVNETQLTICLNHIENLLRQLDDFGAFKAFR